MDTDTSISHEESHPLMRTQITDDKLTLPTHQSHVTPEHDSHNQETLGYLFMLVSAACFSIHDICIRLSETHYDVSYSVNLLIRGIIHLVFSTAYFAYISTSLSNLFSTTLTRRQLTLLNVRGLVGTLSLLAFYYSVSFIQVGAANAIFFLVPIFTLLLSRAFLSEPIGTSDTLAVILSALGAILIAYSQQQDEDEQIYSVTMTTIGCILMAFGAFLASISYTIIRHLGMSVSFMSSVFALATGCVVASVILDAVPALVTLVQDHRQTGGLVACVGAGFVSFVAQVGLNLGLQRARAGPAVLMANMEVPITFVLAFLFLQEMPSFLTQVGACSIIAACLIVGYVQIRNRQNQTS